MPRRHLTRRRARRGCPTSRRRCPTSATSQALPDLGIASGTSAEALANGLGISSDTVTSALDQLQNQQGDSQAQLKDLIGQAVKDGTLTQAQADTATTALDSGVLPSLADVLSGLGGAASGNSAAQ